MRPAAFPPLALALSLGWIGCAADTGPPQAEIDFRLLDAPDDDPYAGGTSLVVALESEGRTDPLEELRFPIDTRRGRAPAVPPGEGYRFRVDVEMDGVVLARGRSLPFAVSEGAPPDRRPDVLLGSLGRFLSPSADPPPAEAVTGIAPTGDGALIATQDGSLYVYRIHHHDPALGLDGEATLRLASRQAARAGARWADLGDGLLLGVGGARGGASLHHGSSADPVAVLDAASLEAHRWDPMVAALPGMRAALVLGGATEAGGAPTDRVARIDVAPDGDGWSLAIGAQGPWLSAPRRGGTAVGVAIDEDGRSCPCARVVVLGGSDGATRLETAELVDPEGIDPPRTAIVGTATEGAAVVVVDRGLVMLAGGRGLDGAAVAEVQVLAARPDMLIPVSPRPEPLPSPRGDVAAVQLGRGLVLLLGGRDRSGMPLRSAEIYDFQVDRFGAAVPTGSLPVPQGAPAAAALADGTVLALGEAGAAVYFPPRGAGLTRVGTAAGP